MIKTELKNEIIKTSKEFISHKDWYCIDDLATALQAHYKPRWLSEEEMKYEDYKRMVCNVRCSKKLEKLGVRQKSLYYWTLTHFRPGKPVAIHTRLDKPIWTLRHANQQLLNDVRRISAFTANELGEILTRTIAQKAEEIIR